MNFDQEKWLHHRELRASMISSLKKSKILYGLTKKEVIALLGYEFNDANSNIWTYYLGKRRMLFPVKSYLYIYFDDFGTVYKIFKK